MQYIVVRTARPHKLVAPDWATNGVGRNGTIMRFFLIETITES